MEFEKRHYSVLRALLGSEQTMRELVEKESGCMGAINELVREGFVSIKIRFENRPECTYFAKTYSITAPERIYVEGAVKCWDELSSMLGTQ